MLCATNCPADCISIKAAESDDPTVEKFPISYEIDMLRCVFCGFCEEACPVDAIRMGPEWQRPAVNGASFIYDIKELAYRPFAQRRHRVRRRRKRTAQRRNLGRAYPAGNGLLFRNKTDLSFGRLEKIARFFSWAGWCVGSRSTARRDPRIPALLDLSRACGARFRHRGIKRSLSAAARESTHQLTRRKIRIVLLDL